MSVLSGQFSAHVAGAEGESEQTFDRSAHARGLVSIENIRPGDLVRPTWQRGKAPFQKAHGASHDPDYPELAAGGNRMFVIHHEQTFSPHQPEGTKYEVIRERRGRST